MLSGEAFVGLLKRFEDRNDFILGHPDTDIGHGYFELAVSSFHHGDVYAARVGEVYGVEYNVVQNAHDYIVVTHNPGGIQSCPNVERQRFIGNGLRVFRFKISDQPVQIDL